MSWRALRAADSHDILTQRTSHVTSPCETKSTLNPTSKTRTTTLYSATCTTTQWFLSSPPHHFNGILLFCVLVAVKPFVACFVTKLLRPDCVFGTHADIRHCSAGAHGRES